ncbi:hypothetical protein ABH945_004499 [Paraburkholderia sp. GAS333]|uniref:TniQ family protein n=1 Tax=Paraburkholderia sp. GAS333 TaxID=3156279 RepID=UPI003D1CE117
MAIALFPHLDGETLGSNFGRYGEFIGVESTLALRRRLFGYPCKPDTRLPSGLNHLAEETKDYWNLDAEQIIKKGTEFYYATATMSAKQRETMLSDMLEQPCSRILRRSAGGWGAESVAKFRYCEECLAQWRENGTPAHWMVDHQLPGVYVCAVHSMMLKVAKQGISQNLTDHTVMALKDVEDEEILVRASSTERAAFAEVAKLSAQYRIGNGRVPSAAMYRELLRTGGYAWLTGGVDIRTFTASMVEYFGHEYCQLTGLSLKRLAIWLKNIEGDVAGGEASHPFVFISVVSLLNARCASPGTFIPAKRNEDAEIAEVSTENGYDDSCQRREGLLCKGIIHRANDIWREDPSDCQGRELVCSCGVTYRASEVRRSVDEDMSVISYGERYRDLVSMRFADNFNIGSKAQGFSSVNPRLLRWARFSGFSRRRELSEETIQDLRDQWIMIVKSARPEKRVLTSYQIDSRLYRTLYRHDRKWISEFNKENRTQFFKKKKL